MSEMYKLRVVFLVSAMVMPVMTILAMTIPIKVMAQSCHADSMPESTPNTQYVVHGDGTITDVTTGLMWMQCSEGLSEIECVNGEVTLFSWDLALQVASDLNTSGGFANYTDWRLPNAAEMLSIVEEQCVIPAINESVFPATANAFYWTASPNANNAATSWFVDFNIGDSGNESRTSTNPVRLVRSIQ